jgi:hypothetical protein
MLYTDVTALPQLPISRACSAQALPRDLLPEASTGRARVHARDIIYIS